MDVCRGCSRARTDPGRTAPGLGKTPGSCELYTSPPWSSNRLAARSRCPGRSPSRFSWTEMESAGRDAAPPWSPAKTRGTEYSDWVTDLPWLWMWLKSFTCWSSEGRTIHPAYLTVAQKGLYVFQLVEKLRRWPYSHWRSVIFMFMTAFRGNLQALCEIFDVQVTVHRDKFLQ